MAEVQYSRFAMVGIFISMDREYMVHAQFPWVNVTEKNGSQIRFVIQRYIQHMIVSH